MQFICLGFGFVPTCERRTWQISTGVSKELGKFEAKAKNHYRKPPNEFDERIEKLGEVQMGKASEWQVFTANSKNWTGGCVTDFAIVYGITEKPERKRKTLSDLLPEQPTRGAVPDGGCDCPKPDSCTTITVND